MYYMYLGDLSSAPAGTHSPAVVSSAISHFRSYLRTVYKNSSISPETKWPPTPSREYITLAVVEGGKCRDEYIGHTLQGNIQQLLKQRREISMQQILEPPKSRGMRLVLVEGAPGIGKSTLTSELCRKWEEFSCMQQYSLVILLRLREEEVQNITKVSKLFYAYESEDKKSLKKEVLRSQGKSILFILDGFDEFPKNLQQKSFLLNLIKGSVLPESTVLVTSRPSATALLLTSCRPQKRVEIVGFAQESVEAYAESVFVAEPEKLEGFKAYISVSKNPAINSLMYVPLNAAIVVQIYLSSKSDSVLPHTLTELYTQLCLTILKRYLDVHHPAVTAVKFDDLPSDLYSQFLKLCQIAFEGMENEAVIFNTHPAFTHFGFLNAVSALYGVGEISYNFLHFTLQEFLAAYHISQLAISGRGPELFECYSEMGRWNVVWRFVAGLTKFKHFTTVDMNKVLFDQLDKLHVSNFFIECLFEAKTIEYFNSFIRAVPTICVRVSDSMSAFGMYALGYCIANIHTGKPWSLYMWGVEADLLGLFVSGLKTNVPSIGTITEVKVANSDVSLADIRFCFPTVSILKICLHRHKEDFSDYIVHNTSLTELVISDTPLGPNFLLLLLQKLWHSNVTSLDIYNTDFCKHFRESPHSFYLALEQLIVPTSGRLTTLKFGDKRYVDEDSASIGEGNSGILATAGAPDDDLVRLVSSPSSLKCLALYGVQSSLFPLKSNTCLTELAVSLPSSKKYFQQQVSNLIDVVKYNQTLQHLEIVRHVNSSFGGFSHIDAEFQISPLLAIARAVIDENTTLQSVKFNIPFFGTETTIEFITYVQLTTVSLYLREYHEYLTLDSRITWLP